MKRLGKLSPRERALRVIGIGLSNTPDAGRKDVIMASKNQVSIGLEKAEAEYVGKPIYVGTYIQPAPEDLTTVIELRKQMAVRLGKSLACVVTDRGNGYYSVASAAEEPHTVYLEDGALVCDCPDFVGAFDFHDGFCHHNIVVAAVSFGKVFVIDGAIPYKAKDGTLYSVLDSVLYGLGSKILAHNGIVIKGSYEQKSLVARLTGETFVGDLPITSLEQVALKGAVPGKAIKAEILIQHMTQALGRTAPTTLAAAQAVSRAKAKTRGARL